ncbi:MAG: carbohydrate ABC transporter permease [Thermomicrobiales bacterium]
MAKAVQIESTPKSTSAQETRLRVSKFARAQVFPRFVLVFLGFFYLLPFYWMLVNALKSNEELRQQPPTWYPHHLEWANFQRAINVMDFWHLLRNTSIITFFTVLGVGLTVPMVAYGFSRVSWPGRDKVFVLVLATVFIPFPALIVALFDIFAKLQWINTFKPLIVPYFFCFLPAPFWIFLLRQFFMQIPFELSDAAKIDGASELRILFQVIMPQSWPALVSVSMFAALHAWNDFLGPLLYLHVPNKYTLSVGLTFFSSQSSHDIQFNLLMAASVLTVLPVIILFFSFQRAFVEGVTVGAFK